VFATYKYNILFSIIVRFQKISIPILRVRVSLKGEVVSKAEIMERGRLGGGQRERTKKVYRFGFDIF